MSFSCFSCNVLYLLVVIQPSILLQFCQLTVQIKCYTSGLTPTCLPTYLHTFPLYQYEPTHPSTCTLTHLYQVNPVINLPTCTSTHLHYNVPTRLLTYLFAHLYQNVPTLPLTHLSTCTPTYPYQI